MDPKIEKWKKWLVIIASDIQNLQDNKKIFDEIRGIVTSNPEIDKPNYFHDFLKQGYGSMQVIGIRRQLKDYEKDNRSISLAKLLREFSEEHKIVTLDNYINVSSANLHREYEKEVYQNIFEEKFDIHQYGYLNKCIVNADLEKLKESSKKLENVADNRIAHSSTKKVDDLSFREIEENIEQVTRIAAKYHLLLFGGDDKQLESMFVEDWKEIFRVAWIPD